MLCARRRSPLRGIAAAVVAASLLVIAPASTAKRSKSIDPYATFHFAYTKHMPGVATGLRYRVALAEQGAKAPVVERLDLTLAKGTKIALDAVKACRASDEEIQQGGPAVCPAAGRIAEGTARVYLGGEQPLELAATASPAGRHSIVVVLASGESVVRILRGTFRGRTMTVKIPALEVAGTRVALVAFSLDIGGGTAKRPVFRTPRTCTKAGWDVTYAPTFDRIGKVRLVDNTTCRRGRPR
jgi:hypothetical protein